MSSEALSLKDPAPKKEWTPLELAEMKTGKYLGQISRPKGFASRRRIKPEAGSCLVSSRSFAPSVADREWGVSLWESGEGGLILVTRSCLVWRMSKFSGVEIFTYVVMDNHFHILVKVPDKQNGRWGTLWMVGFQSVLVDGEAALATMARRPWRQWRLTLT